MLATRKRVLGNPRSLLLLELRRYGRLDKVFVAADLVRRALVVLCDEDFEKIMLAIHVDHPTG